jgi:hypothetical protein
VGKDGSESGGDQIVHFSNEPYFQKVNSSSIDLKKGAPPLPSGPEFTGYHLDQLVTVTLTNSSSKSLGLASTGAIASDAKTTFNAGDVHAFETAAPAGPVTMSVSWTSKDVSQSETSKKVTVTVTP